VRCLRSIESRFAGVTYEVCVVDNASKDRTRKIVRDQFPRVQLIVNERNLGFAAGVNQGLERTHGPFVLWLNPDAEILSDGLKELFQYMEREPKVGIIGPQILDPDGGVQLSCRSFPSYRTVLCHRYSLLTRWLPQNRFTRDYLHADWDHGEIREVDWVSGACLFHRRAVLRDIGGLDDRFFMYCEDVDFCLRARQAGWAVRYHPGMRVLHQIGGSSGQAPLRMAVERHRSMWRYYAKHFRRNRLKDVTVGTGILGRCMWMAMRGALVPKVAQARPLRIPATKASSLLTQSFAKPLAFALKRFSDLFMAGGFLVLLAPLMALIALAIKLDDGGRVFFAQNRVGRGRRIFRCYKFRTMISGAEWKGARLNVTEDDPRITRVGRILRHWALDELPQLVNVLNGDMSIVGPRPWVPSHAAYCSPQQSRRFDFRPGMAGWALIHGRNWLPWEERIRLDLWYVDHWSLWLDYCIFARAFVALLRRDGVYAVANPMAEPQLGKELITDR